MVRTFLIGIASAVIGAVGLWIGSALGMTFANTVIGVGGGLIIGMVRIGSPLARLIGFLIGFVLGAGFVAMRLGFLPGGPTTLGAAIAIAIILLVITVVSGLSSNRISSWSMVLGALVLMAGFTSVSETTPWTALQQLPDYFLSLLAMSAIGFLVVVVAELLPEKHRRQPVGTTTTDLPPPEPAAKQTTDLDGIIGGAK